MQSGWSSAYCHELYVSDTFFLPMLHDHSSTKIANDIRILKHLKEAEEEVYIRQIRSSLILSKQDAKWCGWTRSLFCLLEIPIINNLETTKLQSLDRIENSFPARGLSVYEIFLTPSIIFQLLPNASIGLNLYKIVFVDTLKITATNGYPN